MIWLISGLVLILVYIVTNAILGSRVSLPQERIDAYLLSPTGQMSSLTRSASPSFFERVLHPVFGRLGERVMTITPSGALQKVRMKLNMAGNLPNFGLVEYFGSKVLSLVLLVPLSLLALRNVRLPGSLHIVAICVIIAIAWWLPDIILQRIIEARQVAIRSALPDMLDLLVISVEAGLSFDGAVQKVVEKSDGPLPMELARVLEQVQLGKSRTEALREMAQRTQVPELISFVASITQAETMGISIANVLRGQAIAVRERRLQFAHTAAAKLPVKLLIPLVFFIFPSLFVVILGPAAIRMIEVFKMMGK